MRKGKLLVAAALACLGANASAWMAIAVGDDNGSFVASGHETAAEAEEAALAGCRKHNSGCAVRARGTVNGKALVLAKGAGGWGYATQVDPDRAAREALEGCGKSARNCRIVTAVWDPGVVWAAVAQASDFVFFRVNAGTRPEAAEEALAGCRKESKAPQTCQVADVLTTSYRAYFALATSPAGSGLGRSETADGAKQTAIAYCRESSKEPDACRAERVHLNESNAPEPASMAKWRATAERNRIAAATPAPQPRPSRTSSTTRSTNVLTCENRCMNGSCVRTFPDGRQERWQAPRVFNPLSNNWEWDTTTNACGA